MTITQIVEDALRAYQPAPRLLHPEGFTEKGGILVKRKGKAEVAHEQVEAELEDVRGGAR